LRPMAAATAQAPSPSNRTCKEGTAVRTCCRVLVCNQGWPHAAFKNAH
jgi:hypothetical protein